VTDVHDFLRPGLVPLGEVTSEAAAEVLLACAALVVVDLEMSGPDPMQHEVLEAGAVRATLAAGFPEERSWGERVKPRHIGNAVHGALKVVGYSPKAWKDAIELDTATGHLATLGAGAVVTGWGISGDLRFLTEMMRRGSRDWPFAPVAVDIQPIARKLLKRGADVDHFNLGHVADRLGIGRMGEHSALADAYATYDVLLALAQRAAAADPGI
jgi:DNA polymerase III alpha subunit (gram-positive type)